MHTVHDTIDRSVLKTCPQLAIYNSHGQKKKSHPNKSSLAKKEENPYPNKSSLPSVIPASASASRPRASLES